MFRKLILPALACIALFNQSCKSDEDPAPAPVTAPTVTMPTITGVDGILVAINTRTKSAGNEIVTGTGYAVFFQNQKPATKVDAGNLTLNTKPLVKSSDNIYFYSPTATEPTGIAFGSQIYWQGTGNTATGVPVISDNDGGGFGNLPVLGEYLTLNGTQDYALNWISSAGADSVIVTIKGPAGTHKKVFPNTISAYTIPKAVIATLGNGSGSVEIINYRYALKTIGTKKFGFLKEAVAFTNKVNIVN